jgi:hypothetical protein
MNIRFSEEALRCRVNRDELQRLLAGRSIALQVPLPKNHSFRASVRPALLGGWQLETDPTGVWLSIPRLELEALAESLPNKEGIEQKFPTAKGAQLLVSFEVDVKDKGKK